MVDVYVSEEWAYHKDAHYIVWVDGEKYDEFTSRTGPLTFRQQIDVSAGYSEALNFSGGQ